jgi:hypothetical protein
MKKAIALLLAALVTLFGLTACGTDQTDRDTSNPPMANGSADNNSTVDSSTSAQRAAKSKDAEESAEESAMTSDAKSAENASGNQSDKSAAGSASTKSANQTGVKKTATAVRGTELLQPASYGQMLRNARVHDADGFLRDGENSVTPGALY